MNRREEVLQIVTALLSNARGPDPLGKTTEPVLQHVIKKAEEFVDAVDVATGAGSVYARFDHILQQLERIFPGEVNMYSSSPPELEYLKLIKELKLRMDSLS